jgi:hypothetical protein
MYPPLLDTECGFEGFCQLPDGREYFYEEWGKVEGDTNAYVVSDFNIYLCESEGKRHKLSPDEFNEELTINGKSWFLHEYVAEGIYASAV